MRFAVYLPVLLLPLVSTGCFWGHHKNQSPPPNVDLSSNYSTNGTAAANKFTVTPDESVAGRVSSVNENLRFVVLTFPLGQLPAAGTRMNVYRGNAIVGEVLVGTQQRDDNSVADIVLGEAKKGDEVRPK